eukprot:2495971-Pyramimonas_sp.AAC.1
MCIRDRRIKRARPGIGVPWAASSGPLPAPRRAKISGSCFTWRSDGERGLTGTPRPRARTLWRAS